MTKTRVLIEVKGGAVQYYAADRKGVEIYLIDHDNLESSDDHFPLPLMLETMKRGDAADYRTKKAFDDYLDAVAGEYEEEKQC